MELKNPSDNLHIYKQVRSVPEDAQKPFESSCGKKLTEINSMWRLQKLTELFGPCGEGWYTEVTRQERVSFPNGEVCIFTDINLYLKDTKTGKWSRPRPPRTRRDFRNCLLHIHGETRSSAGPQRSRRTSRHGNSRVPSASSGPSPTQTSHSS